MVCFDDAAILSMVKADLSLVTKSKDDYLFMLINAAREQIKREGIVLTDSIGDAQLVVMYAAYLFRKRAEDFDAAGMPRMLRYALNNRLFAQKASEGDVVDV